MSSKQRFYSTFNRENSKFWQSLQFFIKVWGLYSSEKILVRNLPWDSGEVGEREREVGSLHYSISAGGLRQVERGREREEAAEAIPPSSPHNRTLNQDQNTGPNQTKYHNHDATLLKKFNSAFDHFLPYLTKLYGTKSFALASSVTYSEIQNPPKMF